jgi:diguanylate cyclase (GGDEF)-like protein
VNSISKELSQTELFRGVSESVIQLVAQQAKPFELEAGELLLSPEHDNEYVYILLSGKLALHFDSLNSPEIREICSGVSVGEMSIMDGMPPSAYVVAKEPCRVFPVQRNVLQKLIEDSSPIAANLLRLLTQWLRDNTVRIVKDRAQIWELTDHANIDALTRLYNRRWLDNTFPRLLEQSGKVGQSVCVLLIDVDRFKVYNDTQGHLGGDQALIAMGEVLRNSVRAYDFATRYGGEEFLVILPNSCKDEGITIAERIRLNAQNKVITTAEGTPLPSITISIGLAMNEPDSTAQSMFAIADRNLYRAKESGRNCVRY